MTPKIIFKKDIKPLLKKAGADFDLYFPAQDNTGDCRFVRFREEEKALSKLCLDYDNLAVSPKNIFFPQIEKMFSFNNGNIAEPKGNFRALPKFIFGIRACDLKGLLFSDDFYARNFKDKYYLTKLKGRLTVVVACLKPARKESCFCASSKTGPFLDKGYDLQLTDLGESYLAEIGSRKGAKFVKKHKKFFKNSDRESFSLAKTVKKNAALSIELKVDFFGAIKYFKKNNAPKENYKRIAERCIYCGGCLYVCPTCTCFNVFDYRNSRLRNWDNCIFEGYSRESSGHNPRAEKWQRTARRYEHKLKYDYQATGVSGCIGCGRCLDSCPVNIGISKFIQEITENKNLM